MALPPLHSSRVQWKVFRVGWRRKDFSSGVFGAGGRMPPLCIWLARVQPHIDVCTNDPHRSNKKGLSSGRCSVHRTKLSHVVNEQIEMSAQPRRGSCADVSSALGERKSTRIRVQTLRYGQLPPFINEYLSHGGNIKVFRAHSTRWPNHETVYGLKSSISNFCLIIFTFNTSLCLEANAS